MYKRKKVRKGNKQRESGINVVVNLLINLHAPSFIYGHLAMPPPLIYSSGGFKGLLVLLPPVPPCLGSSIYHCQLLMLSLLPLWVPGNQKALSKDFIFKALR